MPHLPDDFRTKRFCLQAMLWSGLLLTAHTRQTTSAVGAPVKRDGPVKRDDFTTRTVTLSIAYKPTLAPGDANYELLGCYGHTGLDAAGAHPFGKEADFASPSSVNATKLTVYACLDGCMRLSPPNGSGDHFRYAGVKNGSECFCGLEVASGATKLDTKNCTTPCSGDSKAACGGSENLAIYKYIPDSKKGVASETSSATSTTTHNGNQLIDNTLPPTVSTTSLPDQKTPASTVAVAAVTGSLSGAVLLAGILFFFCRWQRKNKNIQDAHVNAMLSKHEHNAEPKGKPPLGILATNANVHDDIHLTIQGGLVPTTPALERGPKRMTNFPNTPIQGGGQTENRDSLYTNLMDEVRSPPKTRSEGNSSSVQWRTVDHGGGAVPPSPRIASPPPSAGVQGLGDRAWHRRRLSTPFAPPDVPLPPNPPPMLNRGAGRGRGRGRGQGQRGGIPSRPPRRGSVATFEVGSNTPTQSPSATSFSTKSTEWVRPVAPLKLRRLGAESSLNIQTSTTPAKPSSVGRNLTGNRGQISAAEERQPAVPILPPVRRADTMNFDSPVLPPLEPGERFNFDSRAWKDLPNTPVEVRTAPQVPIGRPQENKASKTEARREVNEDGVSPASTTTVGTSILDSPTILDWAAR
ncbi:hypothetical protein SCAR479_08701 [Seiridium cardinale]|uniref:WSC domain-containing protein n=1 Tax=Seiridium cardinale TaxID=138064 RepID=A0ABR2XLD3_9PEZI